MAFRVVLKAKTASLNGKLQRMHQNSALKGPVRRMGALARENDGNTASTHVWVCRGFRSMRPRLTRSIALG